MLTAGADQTIGTVEDKNPLEELSFRPERAMPNTLVVVRHGESQANVINRAMKKNIISEYPEGFTDIPDREIRLTRKGVEQAKATGKWLKEQYPQGFKVMYVSDHNRAKETAAHVCQAAGWHDTEIRIDPLLGERNWGNYTHSSAEERARIMEYRKRDPLHTPMPDGETILGTRLRSRQLLERAARQYAGEDVLIFSHGEYMEALWAEIAHMNTERQREFFASEEGNLRNCQVVEFSSRETPESESTGKLERFRSSCPYSDIEGEWDDISKERYTPSALLEQVERYDRLDFEIPQAS